MNCLRLRRGQLLNEIKQIDKELEELAANELESDLIQAEEKHVRREDATG